MRAATGSRLQASAGLFWVLLVLCCATHGDAQAASTVYVHNTYDLAYALWSQVTTIYLESSLVITPDGLPPTAFTISARHVTISPAPNVTDTVTLDFGSLQTAHRVEISSGATVTLQNLNLKNYYFASLETRNYDTVLPFFVVDTQGLLEITNVTMVIDPTRCASRPDYAKFAESVRTPWLISLDPNGFKGAFTPGGNGTYLVQHALVPQNYMRTTLTDVVPANVGGNIQLTNQTWACLNSSLPVQGSTQISSRVFTPDQLNYALTQLDSRTIFVQQNFSFSQTQASVALPIVIANYRVVNMVAACTDNSTDDPTALIQATLSSTISSDVWQVGYTGTLNMTALTLALPSPCCSTLSVGGTWYFAGTQLQWRLFDVVLPAAVQVLAVRYPTLTPPAYMNMTDMTIVYQSCDQTAWQAAVAQLTSLAATPAAGTKSLSYNQATRTLSCSNCTFLGTAAGSQLLLDQVSMVSLVNTTITCTAFNGSAGATAATAGAGHRWDPPLALAVVVPAVLCAAVALGLLVLHRVLQRQLMLSGRERLPDSEDGKPGKPGLQEGKGVGVANGTATRAGSVAAKGPPGC